MAVHHLEEPQQQAVETADIIAGVLFLQLAEQQTQAVAVVADTRHPPAAPA